MSVREVTSTENPGKTSAEKSGNISGEKKMPDVVKVAVKKSGEAENFVGVAEVREFEDAVERAERKKRKLKEANQNSEAKNSNAKTLKTSHITNTDYSETEDVDRSGAGVPCGKREGGEGTDSLIRMAVALVGFPDVKMTEEQAEAVGLALVEVFEVFKPYRKGEAIQFTELQYENGCLMVTCVNSVTELWMYRTVPKIQKSVGAKLIVGLADYMLKGAKFVLLVNTPLIRRSDQHILDLFQKQNRDITTSKWKIIRRVPKPRKTEKINLWVDDKSSKDLKAHNFKLFLGLYRLDLRPWSTSDSVRRDLKLSSQKRPLRFTNYGADEGKGNNAAKGENSSFKDTSVREVSGTENAAKTPTEKSGNVSGEKEVSDVVKVALEKSGEAENFVGVAELQECEDAAERAKRKKWKLKEANRNSETKNSYVKKLKTSHTANSETEEVDKTGAGVPHGKREGEEGMDSSMRLAVVPMGFPDVKMTEELAESVGLALTKMLSLYEKGEPIQFTEAQYENGCLMVTCVNTATEKWMYKTVPKIAKSVGAELLVGMLDYMLKGTQFVLWVWSPLMRRSNQEILDLFQKQNRDITTTEWKIVRRVPHFGTKERINLWVDDKSFEDLKARSFTLFLGFYQVYLLLWSSYVLKGRDLKLGSQKWPLCFMINRPDSRLRVLNEPPSLTSRSKSKDETQSREGSIVERVALCTRKSRSRASDPPRLENIASRMSVSWKDRYLVSDGWQHREMGSKSTDPSKLHKSSKATNPPQQVVMDHRTTVPSVLAEMGYEATESPPPRVMDYGATDSPNLNVTGYGSIYPPQPVVKGYGATDYPQFRDTGYGTTDTANLNVTGYGSAYPPQPGVMGYGATDPPHHFEMGYGATDTPNLNVTGYGYADPPDTNVSGYGSAYPPQPGVMGYGATDPPHHHQMGYGATDTHNLNVMGYGSAYPPNPNVTGYRSAYPANLNVTGYGSAYPPNSNVTDYGSAYPPNSNVTCYGSAYPPNLNVTGNGSVYPPNLKVTGYRSAYPPQPGVMGYGATDPPQHREMRFAVSDCVSSREMGYTTSEKLSTHGPRYRVSDQAQSHDSSYVTPNQDQSKNLSFRGWGGPLSPDSRLRDRNETPFQEFRLKGSVETRSREDSFVQRNAFGSRESRLRMDYSQLGEFYNKASRIPHSWEDR